MTNCDENCNFYEYFIKKKNYNPKSAIATNITSTASINCHSKKARDCYILHKVLLVIILLMIITFICYHAKQKGTLWNEN